MRTTLVLLSLSLGVGCGGSGGDSVIADPNSTGSFGTGKIFVAWTLAGQPPTTSLCSGIDHLDLELDGVTSTITIEPIPCDLTRFRYDGLPDGDATIVMNAYDASNCVVAQGQVQITVADTLPSSPNPTVAIPAAQPCR